MTIDVPLILILDIDGTLIGHIGYLASYWTCAKSLKVDLTDVKKNIICQLKNGIVRPYFGDFIKRVRENYKNVELFVYTAANDDWAIFLIGCIEEIFDVSFNKPIFARNSHCILGLKLLILVIPDIMYVINTKYNSKFTYEDIRNRIIIFDDCPGVYNDPDDVKKVIQCPIYTQTGIIEDVFYINEDIYNKYSKEIILGMLPNITIRNSNNYDDFIKSYEKYVKLVKLNNNVDTEFSINYWRDFDIMNLKKYLV